MNQFKQLNVWKSSMRLTKEIYLLTAQFPIEERYGLSNQMRRSAVSIASNIAEGAGRNSRKEFVHYLSIATGSACELLTQVLISCQMDYIDEEAKVNQELEISHLINMLTKLQGTLKRG